MLPNAPLSSRVSGLGRGLDALFRLEDEAPAPDRQTLVDVPLDRIRPNPQQPRTAFAAETLAALARSIQRSGLLQPLVVKPDPERKGHFVLISGERRWRAAQEAGLDAAPSVVRTATEQDSLVLALVENIQRADLSPLEQAGAFAELTARYDLTHAQVGDLIGLSRAAVTNLIRLLELPAAVKAALDAQRLSVGHARALLAVPEPAACQRLLQNVLDQKLNVRQTEELVRAHTAQAADARADRPPEEPAPTAAEEPAASPVAYELQFLEKRLRERFQTKVRIQRNPAGAGNLILSFYDDASLNQLVESLLSEMDET